MAILSLLFSDVAGSFYLRQIVKMIQAGTGAVQRELKQLSDAGIITRSTKGRQVHYQANPDSPVFMEIKGLVTKKSSYSKSADQGLRNKTDELTGDKIRGSILIPEKKIADFCRRYYIKRLSLFGSALREDFSPDSDIDILVEFESGHTPGFAIIDMEEQLSRIIGRNVDLRTARELSRYFRDQVMREAKVQYDATQ